MTLTYFNDINVYYHMKNHYKMLKQAKSVIDTSLPQSLLKSPLAMQSFQKRLKGTTNEQLRKIYNSPVYMPKRSGQVKKHNCLNSEAKSEASLGIGSFPSRPTTRRNPIVTPKESLPPRSFSVGPPTRSEKMFRLRQKKRLLISSNRSNNTENQSTNLQLDSEKENAKSPDESPTNTKRCTSSKNNNENVEKSPKTADTHFFKESSEEHEYLLFLLRITEDIIVNDFYSNTDIMQVFKFHIEANQERLSVRKMRHHIKNLCRELNIDCKEYQTTNEEPDETDSPSKFKNSPLAQPSYLTSEAFLNCHDCSAIRKSSLYKIASPYSENSLVMDNLDIPDLPLVETSGDSSISPSLLKLLEKLSLGRVTECTEPVASTSTMNTPKGLMVNNFGLEEFKNYDMRKSPVDFDTFVKELNSEGDIFKSNDYFDDSVRLKKATIALETPPLDIYGALIQDNPLKELQESMTVISSKIFPENSLNAHKLFNEESKSDLEISDRDIKSFSISDKYESEFEKSISSNSILKYDKSEKSYESGLNSDEIKEETIEIIRSDKSLPSNEQLNDNIKEKEEIVDQNSDIVVENDQTVKNYRSKKNSPLILTQVKIAEFDDKNTLDLPESLLDTNRTSDPKTDNSNHSEVKISPKVDTIVEKHKQNYTETEKTELNQIRPELSGQTIVTTTSNSASSIPIASTKNNQYRNKNIIQSFESPQNTDISSSKLPEHQVDSRKNTEILENQDSEQQDTVLKVFLQGSLDDNDYVMIKGPVYVYKPLLESEPKLVVFNNENDQKSRRNSLESQHSNKTFTVDNSHVKEQSEANQQHKPEYVDEAIQFDTNLHSLVNDSMENMLELTRRAYTQFTDSRLLQSDYDLTPQKESDDKYHYLLVDASTSISGVNIKESLLLSDDYLVKNEHEPLNDTQTFYDSGQNVGQNSIDDIDDYLKLGPKIYDNNYIIHTKRKLGTSASMPKLTVHHSTTTNDSSSYRQYDAFDGKGDGNELNNGKLLTKCSSDLMNFDLPSLSQDSSLRSEGETYQNIDRLKNWVPINGCFH